MRIEGWSVDGFGVLQDYQIQDVSPNLTVFLGPNEAGKSTLLDFIRAMLFELKGKPDQRPPVLGGRYGGTIHLSDSNGERLTVERGFGARTTARFYASGGESRTEADLARLLGNCDRAVYRSVFAFSLTELQAIETLDRDEVKDHLFSSGIVGAGKSARDVIKRLSDRSGKQLKERVSTEATINDLARRSLEIRGKLASAKQQAGQYQDAQRRLEECQRTVDELSARIDEIVQDQWRVDTLIDLWPIWAARDQATSTLRELANVAAYPDDAEMRLERVWDNLERSRKAYRDADEQLDRLRRQRQSIELRPEVFALDAEVTSLSEDVQLQRDRLDRMGAQSVIANRASARLTERLTSLGPNWDRARLAGFNDAIPAREEIRARQLEVMDGRRELAERRKQHEQEILEVERLRTHARLRADAVAATSVPVSAEILADQEQSLVRLAAGQQDLVEAENRRAAAQQVVESLAAAGGPNQEPTGRDLPGWARPIVVTLAVAASAGAVWQAVDGSAGIAAVLALVAVALMVLGVVGVTASRRRAELLSRHAAHTASVRAAEATLGRSIADTDRIRREIGVAAAVLGISTGDSRADVAAAEAVMAARRRDRAEYDRLAAEARSAEERVAERTASAELLAGLVVSHELALAESERRWEQWKSSESIPAHFSADGITAFFDELKLAREALAATAHEEDELRRLQEAIEAFDERVRAALAAASQPAGGDSMALLARLELLAQSCTQERDRRTRASGLDAQIAQTVDDVARGADAVEENEAALHDLFAAVGVADAEGYRQGLADFRTKLDLERTVEEHTRQLVNRLGSDGRAAAIERELATGDVGGWRLRREQVKVDRSAADRDRDAAIAMRTEAERRLRELEEASDVVTLEHELAAVTDAAREALHEWRVVRLAEELVRETLSRFQRDRQPAVLADASRKFASVTAGHYSRVVQTDNELTIMDRNDRPVDVRQLSRGTVEQLYLCLRLALARHVAERGQMLPLVMDDVLVNFDPERARSIAERLCEFSRDHQILLFTCHPSTAKLMRDIDPTCGQFEMVRFGGTAPTERPAPI